MGKFYGHFAAAYGTCWLSLMVVAVLSMSYIDLGMFGFLGFPIIGVIYAILRVNQSQPSDKFKTSLKKKASKTSEIVWLRKRVEELQQQLSQSNLPDASEEA